MSRVIAISIGGRPAKAGRYYRFPSYFQLPSARLMSTICAIW
jgi:hypothetical protein